MLARSQSAKRARHRRKSRRGERFRERMRAARKAGPLSRAEIDAYYASGQAERDYQAAKRANREHRIEEAFRARADALAAMVPPAARTESRSRERRDTASRPSSRGGGSGDDPPPDDPDEIAAGAAA